MIDWLVMWDIIRWLSNERKRGKEIGMYIYYVLRGSQGGKPVELDGDIDEEHFPGVDLGDGRAEPQHRAGWFGLENLANPPRRAFRDRKVGHRRIRSSTPLHGADVPL